MTKSSTLLALCGIALACTPSRVAPPAIPDRSAVTFPDGWRFAAGRRASFARNAMVASNDRLASEAGVEILRRGGNAVDAAVAVGFALVVTHPEAGNLGGGGYMVIRLADGTTAAIDYREMAPLAASRDMYLDAEGNVTDKSVVGYLASGVPGAVAGMAAALDRFGTMTLREVIAPALRLAEQGFVVDSNLHRSIRGDQRLIARFAGASVFLPDGEPPAVGSRLRQPMLARTLRLIGEQGPEVFYEGEIADSIVAEMQRGGGIITRADLEGYRIAWRQPIRSTYRGHTLLTMPPSSSGGITITETLNILEALPGTADHASAEWYHRLGSAYQRAFIDRNSKLGDPDFISIPIADLTSKAYARELASSIAPGRATPTASLAGGRPEGDHTTHYSVVDAQGNAVATTTTINSLYGSGVYIAGAGFFMNNEMDDFAAKPGSPNQFGLVQGEQNAIAPRKRMLSAMSPTIVLDPAGELLLVIGARGGPRIITGTSQVILNVLDHRMSLADAMSAPRIHHQALPDQLRFESGGLADSTQAALRAMGYTLDENPGGIGTVIGIMRVRRGWEGFVDPRSYGGAVGY